MSENATTLNRQGASIIPEMWSLSLNKKLDKSGVGMKHISKFGDLESEVLYPSTSKFRVISHMKVPKTANPKLKLHIVVLEEV
jgi:hypothetical protein